MLYIRLNLLMAGYVCVHCVGGRFGGEEGEGEEKSREWGPATKISTWLMIMLCVVYFVQAGEEESGSVSMYIYIYIDCTIDSIEWRCEDSSNSSNSCHPFHPFHPFDSSSSSSSSSSSIHQIIFPLHVDNTVQSIINHFGWSNLWLRT